MLNKACRGLCWALYAYRYQRNKPHGVRATRRNAALLAGMGAHIILTGGRCWELPWLSPSYWLLRRGAAIIAARQDETDG